MDDDDIDATVEDDRLVADLRRIANEVDPVPDVVRAAAHAAITTHHLDRELAILVADTAANGSDLREHPAIGKPPSDLEAHPDLAFEPVRAGPTRSSRLLSFAGNGVQVDIEVNEHGELLDLIGQFTGASAQGCVLEYGTGEYLALEVDSLGRFLVSGVRRGPVRTRCRSAAGVAVTTAWVTL